MPSCKPTMLYNFFNWPSPLVGCGEVCGRSTTHFSQMVDPCTDLSSNNPRTKNLGTVVAPLGGPRGERMRSGGGLWEEAGFRVRHSNRVRHLKCVLLLSCVHHEPRVRWENVPFCNRIVTFGHDFSKNTASIRAFNNQFCPKKSLGDNISHLDRGDFGGIGISCCIANNNVKLAFGVKVGLDLEPLLAFPDGKLHFPQPLCM